MTQLEIWNFNLGLKTASHLGSLLCLSGAAVTERSRTHVPPLAFLHDNKVLALDLSKDVVGNKKKGVL